MKMIKLTIASVLLTVALTSVAYADASQTVATGLGRGLVNMVTCPGEIAHHVVYDTADMNAPGILTGLGKGIVFTMGRFIAGLADFMSLGFIPEEHSIYKGMYLEPYVWEEKWLPDDEKVRKTVSGTATKKTTKK